MSTDNGKPREYPLRPNPGYAFAWAMLHLALMGVFLSGFAINFARAEDLISWRSAAAAICAYCAWRQVSKVEHLKALSLFRSGF